MRKPPLSMTSTVVASVCTRKSCSASLRTLMSSSINCGSVAMSCGLWRAMRLALVDELVQQQARNHVQRFKNSFAFVRGSRERRHLHFTIVQKKFHVFHRRGVRQIALVVLQHVGNFSEI